MVDRGGILGWLGWWHVTHSSCDTRTQRHKRILGFTITDSLGAARVFSTPFFSISGKLREQPRRSLVQACKKKLTTFISFIMQYWFD